MAEHGCRARPRQQAPSVGTPITGTAIFGMRAAGAVDGHAQVHIRKPATRLDLPRVLLVRVQLELLRDLDRGERALDVLL
eukprot:2523960-Prymnesium_polylepis.1